MTITAELLELLRKDRVEAVADLAELDLVIATLEGLTPQAPTQPTWDRMISDSVAAQEAYNNAQNVQKEPSLAELKAQSDMSFKVLNARDGKVHTFGSFDEAMDYALGEMWR